MIIFVKMSHSLSEKSRPMSDTKVIPTSKQIEHKHNNGCLVLLCVDAKEAISSRLPSINKLGLTLLIASWSLSMYWIEAMFDRNLIIPARRDITRCCRLSSVSLPMLLLCQPRIKAGDGTDSPSMQIRFCWRLIVNRFHLLLDRFACQLRQE